MMALLRTQMRVREESRRNAAGELHTVWILERPSTSQADQWTAWLSPFDNKEAAYAALENHTRKGNVRTLPAVEGSDEDRVEATTTYDSKPEKGTLEAWDAKMSPEAYLKRYPKGPKADLAKAHLGD